MIIVIAKLSWFEPRALRVSEAIVDTARSPVLRKICLSGGSMLRVRRDGEAFVVIVEYFVIAKPSWFEPRALRVSEAIVDTARPPVLRKDLPEWWFDASCAS